MSLLSALSEDDGGGWVESSLLKRYQTSRQGEALATERPDVKVTEEGEGAGPRGVHWLTSNCVCGRIKVTRLLTSDQLATI